MIGLLYRLADLARDRVRRRRADPDHATGRRGEDLAHRMLRRSGFTVVARNYRPREGPEEADLIAWEGETLVFVEVKTRASDRFGTPDQAVDKLKREHLERVARDYVRRAGVAWEHVRFDIIAITGEHPPRLVHFRNVFRPKRKL